MHRIAFLLSSKDDGWLGGTNYIRNLFQAIGSIPDRRIEPVIFCPAGESEAVACQMGDVELIATEWLADGALRRTLRAASRRFFKADAVMAQIMKAHAIACVSHSGCFGVGFSLPSINWLPDFQHRRLPDMFSAEERQKRDRAFSQVVRCSDKIIVSSNDARHDLVEFWPDAACKSAAVPFAVSMGNLNTASNQEVLAQKYDIAGPYFFLPNQFWKHKNHAVVVEALALLKAQGRALVVVCSGKEFDHRNPDHFERLIRRVKAEGLAQSFRSLGIVPREDVIGLMRHGVAVINPSMFEGWSTSVEEARAMGKQIILSDIAVHREQAPPRALYFAPTSAEGLAKALVDALAHHVEQLDATHMAEAAVAMPTRLQHYGASYQRLALQVIEDFDQTKRKTARQMSSRSWRSFVSLAGRIRPPT